LEKRHRLDQDYQATLYASNHLLTETKDHKQKTALQKTVESSKADYDKKVARLESSYHEHPIVRQANAKLDELDKQVEHAITDAEQIRDATITHYSEVYHKAKDRYDTLKPYFDKKINIMDPFFLERFEQMQDRLQTAKKDAETELERLAAPKLQRYLEVYYENADEPDLKEYRLKIGALETEKAAQSKASKDRLEAIVRDYQSRIEVLHQAHQAKLAEFAPLEALLDQKDKTIESEYRRMGEQLRKEGTVLQTKRSDQAAASIETLTSEYHKAVKAHAAFNHSMSDDFERLTGMYRPYAKIANRLTPYKHRLRAVRLAHAKQARKEKRAILKRYRNYRIPTAE
jgi:chromosome segregation ATPase